MEPKQIAAQLRKPEGEEGKKVGEVMNKGNEWINRQAIEALSLKPGDMVLEIGMGNGFFAREIIAKHASISYAGCDFSELMVAEAKQMNKEFLARMQFELAPADSLPYVDESFSKILTVNTLYFWQPLAELKEIKRVLQPGGLFVLAIRTRAVMDRMPFTAYGFKKYDEGELKEVLEQAGFIIKQINLEKEPMQEWDGESVVLENLVAICTKP